MEEINWHDWFYYDETSKSCLRWKVDRCGGVRKTTLIVKAGSEAGYRDTLGYWYVTLLGKRMGAHRVVLFLQDGKSDLFVDHINGNPSDNRRQNLRWVTRRQNQANMRKSGENTSGRVGVSFIENNWGNLYAVSTSVKISGETVTKSFSVKLHGLLPAFSMACYHRKNQLLEENEHGLHYTERHGEGNTDMVVEKPSKRWKDSLVESLAGDRLREAYLMMVSGCSISKTSRDLHLPRSALSLIIRKKIKSDITDKIDEEIAQMKEAA